MFKSLNILLFFWSTLSWAQNYPRDYFQAPLEIPLALSGTFGELRGNHFHAGLDIKTQGREGLPVLAAANGQIVRIKVSAYGYGNALYVAHPNGYTTVYGHLQKFSPEVEAWVKTQQYAKQSFEVNLFPPAGKFKVEKGIEIARSGNSGGSGGPHLHFEIRDSKTEETINPALFGIPVSDKRIPSIYHVYAKPVSTGALIDGSSNTKDIALINQGNGRFTGTFSGNGIVGLMVHTIDKQDLSENKNGIYKIEQWVNDTLNFVFTVERFAFSETRYVNAHMDFERKMRYKQMIHKCYLEPGDKLSTYSNVKNRGLIELKASDTKNIKLIVYDSWGNSSTIELLATGNKAMSLTANQDERLSWNTSHTIKMDGVKIYMSANTLYRDENILIKTTPSCSACESKVYQVGEKTIPAHKRYDLSMHKELLPSSNKLVWAVLDEKGRASGLTTTWQGDWLTAHPREFGTFAVMKDTLPPVLIVRNFPNGTVVKKGKAVAMTATDNLSGITKYKAEIDGKWVLLKHDAKRNLFWHDFEDDLSEGNHELLLTFTDEVGNITTYKSVFTFTSK